MKATFKEQSQGFIANIVTSVKSFISKRTESLAKKLSDIPGTNYRLGVFHFNKKNYSDAALRFLIVTWLEPNNAKAFFQLARTHVRREKFDKAKQAITKAKELNPKPWKEADYIANLIDAPNNIHYIPTSIIKQHIIYAYHKGELVDKKLFGYRHKLLLKDTLKNIKQTNPHLHVLDLGCNDNGYYGQLLANREVLENITAVGLIEVSLAKAQKRKFESTPIYTNIIHADPSNYLAEAQISALDVIICDRTWDWNCNLPDIASKLHKALNDNGIVACIFLTHTSDEPKIFDPQHDRFTVSVKEIETVFNHAGFEICVSKPLKLPADTSEETDIDDNDDDSPSFSEHYFILRR